MDYWRGFIEELRINKGVYIIEENMDELWFIIY
jgi:hypothetical protein